MVEPTSTTVRISEDTKVRLRKVLGVLLSQDGKDHTMEEAIQHVLKFYEENHDKVKK